MESVSILGAAAIIGGFALGTVIVGFFGVLLWKRVIKPRLGR